MALLNIAGGHGKMLRVTDEFGGCISLAETVLGTDTMFRGPLFSMGFVCKAITGVGGGAGQVCRIGLGDTGSGSLPDRLWIECEKNSPNLNFAAKLDTGSCGALTIATYSLTLDTSLHSAMLTYDEGGNYQFYVDKVLRSSGARPCADIGEGAVSGTTFSIWGSGTAGAELFYMDDVFAADAIIPLSQYSAIHDGGIP